MSHDQMTFQLHVQRISAELAKRYARSQGVSVQKKSVEARILEASKPERPVQMGNAKKAIANRLDNEPRGS